MFKANCYVELPTINDVIPGHFRATVLRKMDCGY
jgi:hypothetical protein